MTLNEFKTFKFGAHMQCEYDGNIYEIGSVDFKEFLIGLVDDDNEVEMWVRCENINVV